MISINDLIENSVDCTMLVIEYYGMTEIPERKKEIWNSIIALLPNAWLQRRILSLNYAVLQNMLTMRKNHKLAEWRELCRTIYTSVEHPEFLPDPTC